MSYHFSKKISELIKELQDIQKEHGDVWIEATSEGCYRGADIRFVEESLDTKDFRGHSNDDGYDAHVIIGEIY